MQFNYFGKKINRLKNQRVYLAGAIDRVADKGVGWRTEITPFLIKMGVIVLDPLKKTCDIGLENDSVHELKKIYKANGEYDKLTKIMKEIRNTDLRMVDISDFLIVNINIDHHACGTYEEMSLANRSKKPILIHVEQGKEHTPDWLFGKIPHQWFFSNWQDIKNYLKSVNSDEFIETYNRWKFFNL